MLVLIDKFVSILSGTPGLQGPPGRFYFIITYFIMRVVKSYSLTTLTVQDTLYCQQFLNKNLRVILIFDSCL